MPNGHPHFDRAAQDAWFEPLAPAIVSFAARHGLALQRYYHDSPSWDLRFAHPRGGTARLEVLNAGAETARVSFTWWLDDYDTFTRFLHDGTPSDVPRSPEAVEIALRAALVDCLDVPLGAWTRVADDHRSIWSQMSKEAFHAGPSLSTPIRPE